jgi:hypothetical protein
MRQLRRDEMTQPSAHRLSRPASCLLALSALAAGCGSPAQKRLRAVSGEYVSAYASDMSAGAQRTSLGQESTLTLRPDGRWTFAEVLRVDGKEMPVSADSGAYQVQGTTVSLSATARTAASRYTISGDTLRAATGDGSEVGEPLTGVRITDGSPAPFRVRKR